MQSALHSVVAGEVDIYLAPVRLSAAMQILADSNRQQNSCCSARNPALPADIAEGFTGPATIRPDTNQQGTFKVPEIYLQYSMELQACQKNG